MAKDKVIRNKQRVKYKKNRSQLLNPMTKLYTNRDAETGQFIAVKVDGDKFEGIKME